VGEVIFSGLHATLAQVDLKSGIHFSPRAFTAIVILIHIFFAELFVGFAIASPVLQAWGARTGSARMDKLAHSMIRFNVLTFSTGATFAVLFLVLLVGFYPQVTASLFTHFFYFFPVIAMISMIAALWSMYSYYYKWDRYSVLNKRRHIAIGFLSGFAIWVWMVILSGVDTFMVDGGGPNGKLTSGNIASVGSAFKGIFNPMLTEMVLHRTVANLSWPAFALAAWAAFRYMRSKSAEDKAFYDWASSLGLTWGVGFLLLQPFVGFGLAYAMKQAQPANPANPQYPGSFDRLMGEGPQAGSFTSHLLYFNLILVVALFVLSNLGMYLGAVRHPDRGGQVAIRAFGLVATIAGLYSIAPPAMFPVFWVRYIAMAVMAVATFGTLVAYVRGRLRFRYGSPSAWYRVTIMALGVIAATTALSMGLMKSNSRYPYTVYNQPGYTVNESPPPTNFGK